jgi:hypothetical protein
MTSQRRGRLREFFLSWSLFLVRASRLAGIKPVAFAVPICPAPTRMAFPRVRRALRGYQLARFADEGACPLEAKLQTA